MNGSFWTWIVAASAVALGLLLLLATSGPPQSAPGVGGAESGASESAYFEPVLPPAQAGVQIARPSQPCSGAVQPAGIPPCSPPVQPVTGLRGGCTPPAGPCPPCPPTWLTLPPRINRALPPCIDECSFVQLHTTLPQPVAGCLRFEWLATRGRFLDPKASDPIYYAPATGFPSGEDVWIVLTVTDPAGIVYTDRVKLHVRNVR